MTRGEFGEIFSEILESYGDRTYPDRMVTRIWDYVKDLEAKEFRQAVNGILDEYVRAPSVAQIRTHCAKFVSLAATRKLQQAVVKAGQQDKRCIYCDSSGKMIAADSRGYNFAFRCHCDAGLTLAKGIPEWRQEYGKQLRLLRLGGPRLVSEDGA